MALNSLDTARLAALKTALEQNSAALTAQGVTVPAGTLHDGIAALIRQIKRIRVESGTWIPAESTATITLPCSSGASLVVVEAPTVLSTTENFAVGALLDIGRQHLFSDQVMWKTPGQIYYYSSSYTSWRGYSFGGDFSTGYAATPQSAAHFVAGAEYQWTAYFWDEEG